jgi:hypothetical protein
MRLCFVHSADLGQVVAVVWVHEQLGVGGAHERKQVRRALKVTKELVFYEECVHLLALPSS